MSYWRWTPRVTVRKNRGAFLSPLESWDSQSSSDFLSLKSSLCILEPLLWMWGQLRPQQHQQILPLSCLTVCAVILQHCQMFCICFPLFAAVQSTTWSDEQALPSVIFSDEMNRFRLFLNFRTRASENHIPRFFIFSPNFGYEALLHGTPGTVLKSSAFFI